MKLLVSCPAGLGRLLSSELKRLQLKPFNTFSKGSWVETDLEGLYRINLWSRLANKVYIQIASWEAKNFDQLFEIIKKSDYGQRSSNSNISLKVTSHHSQLSAQRAIQSVAHKALLEGITHFSKEQEYTEELLLLIEKDQATLLLNSSGPSLHQRGYRTQTGLAPLKENLAAALVLLSSWKFKSPLIDPFCWSGTIAIEALLLAKNIAPWSHRNFAFEKFSRFDQHLWSRLKEEAISKIFDGNYQIYASDMDPHMIRIAKDNARSRGLENDIHFEIKRFQKSDFSAFSSADHWIISNPPYGKRIVSSDLKSLYEEIYNSFDEKSFGGIITSFDQVKPNSEKRSAKPIFNGEDKCTFWTRKLN